MKLREIVNRVARRLFRQRHPKISDTPDDIEHDLLVGLLQPGKNLMKKAEMFFKDFSLSELWERDYPDYEQQLLQKQLYRIGDRLRQKARRDKAREQMAAEKLRREMLRRQQHQHTIQFEGIEIKHDDFGRIRFDEFALIPMDAFEKAVLAIASGAHPIYRTFAQFARAEEFCSKAHAYKRKALFHNRLQKLLTNRRD